MNPIFNTFRPEGFETVNAYLFSEHPEKLIDFLKNSFFAEELNRVMHPASGDLVNAILKIGTSCFMISQAREQYLDMRSSFYLFVDDVDFVHDLAVKNGARVEFEPANMPYKDRQSGIIDPSGNYWWISKRLEQAEYK